MTQEEKNIRKRILAATVDLIEEKGLSRLTVRAIARKARVNVAAINYYYGSKEKLFDAVLGFTLDNAFTDPLAELRTKPLPPRELLGFILADWLQGIAHYPGIARVHVLGHHLTRRQHTRSLARLHSFLEAVALRSQELQPGADPEALRLRIAQAVSAVLVPAMLPELFDGFIHTDLSTPAGREVYLRQLLHTEQEQGS